MPHKLGVRGEQLLEGASTLALGAHEEEEQRVGSHSPLCLVSLLLSRALVDRQKPLLRHNTAVVRAQVLKPESGFISHFHRIVASVASVCVFTQLLCSSVRAVRHR